MVARAYVGQSNNQESSNDPLKGVEGILGVVIALSYLAGGKNIFPEGVDPFQYGTLIQQGGEVFFSTSDEKLSQLVQICSQAVNRHLKTLTLGSLKNYLSRLRYGQRPNGGVLPAVRSTYDKNGQLDIFARDFDRDVENGIFGIDCVPAWIFALAARRRFV